MGNSNPRLLNLDDLELTESDITVRHQGVDHKMRVLTVDMFVAQQKRQLEHQRMVAAGKVDPESEDITDVVSLIKDAILEFFPTLPVGELPTPKLFTIFAWLNELSGKINEIASEGVDAVEVSEGNELEDQTVA